VLDLRILAGKHLKMQLKAADAGNAEAFDAIAFGYIGGGAEDARLRSGTRLELAYRLEVNEFRGSERAQLNCQHLRIL
jgi:single-stranded-DNA-specific exonuclease